MELTVLTSYLLLLLLPILFSACLKDSATKTYTLYKPVFKLKSEVLAGVRSNSPQKTIKPGKIYLHGNYIFLNDIERGVHIIDNSDPSAPKKVAFIAIPGNADIAIKGNTLYADIYSDLLAIDITDPLQAKITKSLKNVFLNKIYINGIIVPDDSYVVDWTRKDTVVQADNQIGVICPNCQVYNSAPASAPAAGVGGSMARFAIVNDYLYTVGTFSLTSINIGNPSEPTIVKTNNLGNNIETIYPFSSKLFIGSSGGMHVLTLDNPASPVYASAFQHATACDPVIANDQYAYVTLRGGTICTTTIHDQMQIINVSDIYHPFLVKTYPLTNPYGLALDNNLLWVCDGKAGLKLYDVRVPSEAKLLRTISGIEAFDVILQNKKMIVTAKEGLIQYDYNNLDAIRRLSIINTSNY